MSEHLSEHLAERLQEPEVDANTKIREALQNQITFTRLSILQETDEQYRIQYGEREIFIRKGKESSFLMPSEYVGGGMRLQMTQFQQLNIDTQVLQDAGAPSDFIEVMMFHELREMEYVQARFIDAHNRAVHDEILYVLKFFQTEQQAEYFDWAAQYRRHAMEKNKSIDNEDMEYEKEYEKSMAVMEKLLLDQGLSKESHDELRGDRFGFADSISDYFISYVEEGFGLCISEKCKSLSTQAQERINELCGHEDGLYFEEPREGYRKSKLWFEQHEIGALMQILAILLEDRKSAEEISK